MHHWYDGAEGWHLVVLPVHSVLNQGVSSEVEKINTRADKKPWITTEFLESTNERDNLSWMAKSRGCPVLKEHHRIARNRVVTLKREFKRHFVYIF